jgi:precorrin-3B synthase
MVNQNVMRRGFCPGVWAPMESGDGLLVRARARRGRLQAEQIRGLAHAARAFGNGIVELTRRANLQLRGVSPASLPDLQAELVRLQLASASLVEERRPALSVCPLAGLDPRCPPLEPMAEALESLLATPELSGALSEKFLLLVSGGSGLFDELELDVHVQLCPSRPDWARLSIADASGGALELGACRASDAARAVQTLLVLLGATVPEHARMRQLVAARGPSALRDALAPLLHPLPGAGAQRPSVQSPAAAAEVLGFRAGVRSWFGLELPFGSLEAADWQLVAELAERFGSGEVRLLPGRALLLPGVRESDGPELAQLATARHFIVERPLPWLRLVACSGAPACRSAHAETRQLACDLADLVRTRLTGNATLHVSGCEKGCAWGGAADITLVHGADGCRIGFGASVAETARTAALGLDAIRERLVRAAGPARPPAAVAAPAAARVQEGPRS